MIKARTTYDGGHKWAIRKFIKPVNIYTIIFLTLGVLWICAITYYAVGLLQWCDVRPEFRSSVVELFIADGIVAVICIHRILGMRKNKKKIISEAADETVRDFAFTDDRVTLDYSSREESGSFSVTYDAIISAAETKDYFLFSVETKRDTFAIAKRDITEGTAEELSAIFAEKLGKRFGRRCK